MPMNERPIIFAMRGFLFLCRRIYSFFLSTSFGVSNGRFDFGAKIIGSRKIFIGDNFYCGKHLWLESVYDKSSRVSGLINIHDNVSISDNSHIAAINKVEIQAHCLIGSNVLITDHDHGCYTAESDDYKLSPTDRPIYSRGETIIEANCWIGDGAKILSGVTVGKFSIVAANSVVTKNVKPYTIVAGMPAKEIKCLRGINEEY